VELIRSTLLEGYGIELRENEANETFVSWSTDPQYQKAKIKPKTNVAPSEVPNGAARPRIRIIEGPSPAK